MKRTGVTKKGNIVAETFLRTQMFLSVATRETLTKMQMFAFVKQQNVLNQVKEMFGSRTQNDFSQFSHPGNVTGNNISTTVFPRLGKPLPKYNSVFNQRR